MLLIRRFEERAGQMYGMGLIGGFCHLYIGQEAVVVGMQGAIDDRDAVVTSYRDHGHMLACGMEAKGVMAELTGRTGGYSKGKGGSMHMFSKEKRFYGGHGIVGGLEIEAMLGDRSVAGVQGSPPYPYTFPTPFTAAPEAAVVSLAGMIGANGGWAQTHGPGAVTATSVALSVDEDQVGDTERRHTTERIAVVAVGAAAP